MHIMELLIVKEDLDTGIDVATRWTVRGSNPVWEGDFLYATPVHNGPGAHTEAVQWVPNPFSGGKAAGAWRLSLTPIYGRGSEWVQM